MGIHPWECDTCFTPRSVALFAPGAKDLSRPLLVGGWRTKARTAQVSLRSVLAKEHLRLWTCEQPALFPLVLTLRAPGGETLRATMPPFVFLHRADSW